MEEKEKNASAQAMARLSHNRFDGIPEDVKKKYFSLIRQRKGQKAKRLLIEARLLITS